MLVLAIGSGSPSAATLTRRRMHWVSRSHAAPRPQPKRPVTYCSVSARRGREKISTVGPCSTSLPEVHEGRVVADARGLLHVVRASQDRVVAFNLVDQVLDLAGRHGIEGPSRARP